MGGTGIDSDDDYEYRPPTREQVLADLESWRRRLHALYADIISWLPAEEGYETEIGSYDTDEGPMRVAGVPPQPVPTLKVRRHGELVASFFPDACWIIGVLGRVSIFTGRHRPHTLVEKDFPEERKGWWFRRHDIEERYLASQRDFSILMGVPFTREVLRQLVEVSHG